MSGREVIRIRGHDGIVRHIGTDSAHAPFTLAAPYVDVNLPGGHAVHGCSPFEYEE